MRMNGIRWLLVICGAFAWLTMAQSRATAGVFTGKFAVELMQVKFPAGTQLPPVYPSIWSITYADGTFYAPDAVQLVKGDFIVDSLTKLGSFRVIKKFDDSLEFFDSQIENPYNTGWRFAVRGKPYLARLFDRIEFFLYNDNGAMFPFSISSIVNKTTLYMFRPDSVSQLAYCLFFNFTEQNDFPDYADKDFPKADGLKALGFDPFKLVIPEPKSQPGFVYRHDPVYPPELLRIRRAGDVTVKVLVDRDGTASRVEIAKASRYVAMDNAARNTAFKSLYRPALDKSGRPVPAWLTFDVSFFPPPDTATLPPSKE